MPSVVYKLSTKQSMSLCMYVCGQGSGVCIVFFKYLFIGYYTVLLRSIVAPLRITPNMHHYTFCALKVLLVNWTFANTKISRYGNSKLPMLLPCILVDKYPLTAFDFDIGCVRICLHVNLIFRLFCIAN